MRKGFKSLIRRKNDARFFQLRSQDSLFLFFVLAKKRLDKGLTKQGILRGFTDILFTTGEKRKKR